MSTPVLVVTWALLGMVLGTGLDALHAYNGVLSYTHVAFGLQDWWVPPEFAAAGVAMGFGHRLVAVRVAGRTVPPAPPWEVAMTAAGFILSYGGSGWFQGSPLAYAVAWTAAFVVVTVVTPRDARPAMVMHAVAAALMGPLVESSLSGAGLFHYAHPDFLGVPMWLPPIYLHAAAASAAMDRFLRR